MKIFCIVLAAPNSLSGLTLDFQFKIKINNATLPPGGSEAPPTGRAEPQWSFLRLREHLRRLDSMNNSFRCVRSTDGRWVLNISRFGVATVFCCITVANAKTANSKIKLYKPLAPSPINKATRDRVSRILEFVFLTNLDQTTRPVLIPENGNLVSDAASLRDVM